MAGCPKCQKHTDLFSNTSVTTKNYPAAHVCAFVWNCDKVFSRVRLHNRPQWRKATNTFALRRMVRHDRLQPATTPWAKRLQRRKAIHPSLACIAYLTIKDLLSAMTYKSTMTLSYATEGMPRWTVRNVSKLLSSTHTTSQPIVRNDDNLPEVYWRLRSEIKLIMSHNGDRRRSELL